MGFELFQIAAIGDKIDFVLPEDVPKNGPTLRKWSRAVQADRQSVNTWHIVERE